MIHILDIIDKVSKKILVVGDSIYDHYIFGHVLRRSPEANVPVINPTGSQFNLGGAANVYETIKELYGHVDICTVLGDDADGHFLKQKLVELGNDPELIYFDVKRKTTKKTRIITNDYKHLIRVDEEDSFEIDQNLEEEIYDSIKQIINKYKLLILSDYGKGFITTNLAQRLIDLCCKNNIIVLSDPKSSEIEKYQNSYLLKANYNEFLNFIDGKRYEKKDKKKLISKYAQELIKKSNIDFLYITLGSEGGIIIDKTFLMNEIPPIGKHAIDVTGAGDTVIASIAITLVSGLNILDSVQFSTYAAGVSVSKRGSTVPCRDELELFIRENMS